MFFNFLKLQKKISEIKKIIKLHINVHISSVEINNIEFNILFHNEGWKKESYQIQEL